MKAYLLIYKTAEFSAISLTGYLHAQMSLFF